VRGNIKIFRYKDTEASNEWMISTKLWKYGKGVALLHLLLERKSV
jgi:hypothetical protein